MKSGYGKDADSVFRQKGGKFGKNPCQRKIRDTLNAKSFPAVFLCSHVRRNLRRWTDQRRFLIGFAEKAKCTSPIHLGKDRIFQHTEKTVSICFISMLRFPIKIMVPRIPCCAVSYLRFCRILSQGNAAGRHPPSFRYSSRLVDRTFVRLWRF